MKPQITSYTVVVIGFLGVVSLGAAPMKATARLCGNGSVLDIGKLRQENCILV